jgi:hypothetical protein
MSVGPIPFAAIDAYATRYGIDGEDDFDRFLALIRAMDSELVKTKNKPANTVEASDTEAVRGLFGALGKLPAAGRGNKVE